MALKRFMKKLKVLREPGTVYSRILEKLGLRSAYAHPIFVVKNNNTDIRVHVGAGEINLQGWINIDARDKEHIHICTDRIDLGCFTDGTLGEIYACHVLEHFSNKEICNLLSIFHRKLKVGGILRVSVPDFDRLLEIYHDRSKDLSAIILALFGGQEYEFNYHKTAFNEELLRQVLSNSCFTDIMPWDTCEVFGRSIGDWSDKKHQLESGISIPISLNLECRKGYEKLA